jgi:hypothetical protein
MTPHRTRHRPAPPAHNTRRVSHLHFCDGRDSFLLSQTLQFGDL